MKSLLKLTFLLFTSTLLHAQTFTTIADSLRLPIGLEASSNGRVWVVESGYGFDDGAVSILEANGQLWPVVVGLSSRFDTTTHENVGPWHTLALPGNKLAVTSGATGQVLIFDLSAFVPGVTPPLAPTAASVSMDLKGFLAGQGIMESDPYTLARDAAGNFYVADAAANAIVKVTTTGQMSVFATFPPFANPLPFGPPVVDAVPTRIIARPDGGFYVSTLTGFPFIDGTANVFSLDAAGNVTPYATGLTQLTDLALDPNTGDLYALQIGHFDLMGTPPGYAPNSAKVMRLKPDGSREVAAENFDLGAGMTFDGQGNLYVAELGSGRVLKTNSIATGLMEKPAAVTAFTVSPNPVVGSSRISFDVKKASSTQLHVINASGQLVFSQNLGLLEAGAHEVMWQAAAQPAGVYEVELVTNQGISSLRVVVR